MQPLPRAQRREPTLSYQVIIIIIVIVIIVIVVVFVVIVDRLEYNRETVGGCDVAVSLVFPEVSEGVPVYTRKRGRSRIYVAIEKIVIHRKKQRFFVFMRDAE